MDTQFEYRRDNGPWVPIPAPIARGDLEYLREIVGTE